MVCFPPFFSILHSPNQPRPTFYRENPTISTAAPLIIQPQDCPFLQMKSTHVFNWRLHAQVQVFYPGLSSRDRLQLCTDNAAPPLQGRPSSRHCLMGMMPSLTTVLPSPSTLSPRRQNCLISKTPSVGSILSPCVLDAQVKAWPSFPWSLGLIIPMAKAVLFKLPSRG